MFDALGNRMKGYEAASRVTLPLRLPLIVRVDGRSFHNFTRGMARPFDAGLVRAMNEAARRLCEDIQGARMAYVQSDEISVLVHNYARLETSAWFDNGLQKIVSVAASIASASVTLDSMWLFDKVKHAHFDGRAFVLPEAEVTNYFLWRQNDAARNSIQMLAQSLYSHKELHGKGQAELHEMCFQKGHNWNDLPTQLRRGRCVVREEYLDDGGPRHRWVVDNEIPIWKAEGREYVERFLAVESDVAEAAE
jgi:tRNA(His) 5'-end guanylyltransferase